MTEIDPALYAMLEEISGGTVSTSIYYGLNRISQSQVSAPA